jgi:hypothetical protein
MERVVVAIIELVEQLDEFVALAGLYSKIVDMKVLPLVANGTSAISSLLLGC